MWRVPDETGEQIFSRFDEVVADLLKVSNFLERDDEEFENWRGVFVHHAYRYHFDLHLLHTPRVPGGTIPKLKKQHKKLNDVRVAVAQARSGLDHPIADAQIVVGATSADKSDWVWKDLAQSFLMPGVSGEMLLAKASLALSMKIANAARSQVNDRRNSPKRS